MKAFTLCRGAIAASFAACALTAHAQEALQCVNPDVLNTLVFNARAESTLVVKRSLPQMVDGFRAPADFVLIGSGVRGQNLSTVVAYKTAKAADIAFSEWLDFLFAQGWRRETPQGERPAFSVQGPQPLAARLCKDGERRNMLVQEISGVRYATIFGFETTPPRACDAPVVQRNTDFMAVMNAARANMPQFSFPANARAGGSTLGGGGGGNMPSDVIRIESPDSAQSLAAHLAAQLGTQGWRTDAQWNGELSTGSTWTRKGDDGQPYWGTLEITKLGQGAYEVGFSLVSRSQ